MAKTVGKRGSRKTTHNRGCGLCHPYRRMGNAAERFTAQERRAAESAKQEMAL